MHGAAPQGKDQYRSVQYIPSQYTMLLWTAEPRWGNGSGTGYGKESLAALGN